MSGLIDTNTGLRYGTGLIWLQGGLGGDGLTNLSRGIIFNGTGNLSASARQIMAVQANFLGQGTVSAYANLNNTASAIFAGAGSLTVRSSTQQISATFAGSGALFEVFPGSGPSLDFSDPNNSQYIGMFP